MNVEVDVAFGPPGPVVPVAAAAAFAEGAAPEPDDSGSSALVISVDRARIDVARFWRDDSEFLVGDCICSILQASLNKEIN